MSQDTNELFVKLAKENNVKFEIVKKIAMNMRCQKRASVYIPNNEIKLK